MSKFTLALGLHNHQPVGNFDFVFEMAHGQAYAPFLTLLHEHPYIRCSLHQSGILWKWQRQHHPEYFESVRSLLARGQIELMTGGFYEPILPAIPERDIDGQVRQLTDYLAEHFYTTPTGLWLTERVWEPYLPKPLARAGVQHVAVDDSHFLYAGLTQEQLTGPFLTEHEDYTITLLPIQKKLRYLIPFGEINDLFDELKRQAERFPNGLAVYADDGEKFGVWPNTHELCYENGWLERFFEQIEKNNDWLQTAPLSEAAQLPSAGRVYVPAASYAEMLQWALPTERIQVYERLEAWLKDQGKLAEFGAFMRGGIWHGFLTKYEESNLMHKKMTFLSDRLAAFEKRSPEKTSDVKEIREHLYAGQCNCAYWHGVFGGLYLPHLRQAIYTELIAAEAALDTATNTNRKIQHIDLDKDGAEEAFVTTDRFSALFKPNRGGMLLDLSLKRHAFSVTDTLTRRKEAYHRKLGRAVTKEAASRKASIHDLVLTKEAGLEQYLANDWYIRRCFIDHFFTPDVNLERFKTGKFGEDGDFILEPYEVVDRGTIDRLRMVRHGHLWRPGEIIPLTVSKEFRFAQGSDVIEVQYHLSSSFPQPVSVRFGIECNFTFLAGHAHDRYMLINGVRPYESFLDSSAEESGMATASLVDEYLGLAVSLTGSRPCTGWRLPIFTVSQSEEGFEKVYQGTTVLFLYELMLTGRPTELSFSLFAGAHAALATIAGATAFPSLHS